MIRRVVTIGTGAIGGAVGAILSRAGSKVAFVARGEHLDAIRRDGLLLKQPFGNLTARCPAFGRVEDVDWAPGDLAILATKLQDAQAALDELLATAGPEVPVACMTNGVDGERWAKQRFDHVLSTMVWTPATYLNPGEVRLHTTECPGVMDTGSVTDGDSDLAASFCGLMRSAGFDAIAREDISRWKAAKLISNLGGAAQALVTDDWMQVALAARAEGEAVLKSAGIAQVPSDELMRRVAAIDCVAVDGQPREGGSTWQSHKRGKPLESPWIEGAVAAIAESIGMPAPINAFLATAALSPRQLTAAEVLAPPADSGR